MVKIFGLTILSKKENAGLLAQIDRLSVNSDVQAQKMKELLARVVMLERSPKPAISSQALNEWLYGKKEAKPNAEH